MSSDAHFGGSSERGPLDGVLADQYEVLRHPRRVRLLEILSTHSQLSLTGLTTELVERESLDVATEAAQHEIRITLVHNHLPRLEAYGFIEWDRETVELVDEPRLCPAALSTLLETDADEERLLERVVDPVRLGLLELVADGGEPQSLEDLASTLATREERVPSDIDRAKIVLHHAHLPALDEVGVLAYDYDEKRIAPTAETDSLALVR